MNRILSAFLIGGLFGLGIVIAGMANPAKVLNFFDIAGTWDPSLAFVMGGGMAVFFVGFRLNRLLRKPLAAPAFSYPDKTKVDAALVLGSIVFGIGWGAAGFCPGPAIANLALTPVSAAIFVAAMLAGSWIAGAVRNATVSRPGVPSADTPAA
jgi:uncharacterized membrane protein YedE/YeeE